MSRNITKSFEELWNEINRQDLLDLWDYESNSKSPSEVAFSTKEKFYFKCENNKHESELRSIAKVSSNTKFHCHKCNSFAQYIIDNYSEDYLKTIWSDKNEKTPWEYAKRSNKEVYFVCKENYDHIYNMSCNEYVRHNGGCPYCSGHRVSIEKSLGILYSESLKHWSDKNRETPYNYNPKSHKEVWWKCPDCLHDDFLRRVDNSVRSEFKCPSCSYIERGINQSGNLVGKVFGELTVVSLDKDNTGRGNGGHWICKCSCGKIISASGYMLRSGKRTTCGNSKIHRSGKNHWNWQGGITPENEKIRHSDEYKEWHKQALKNDHYTCQCCGDKKNLQVHHINSFSQYPELRVDRLNSITLCANCHDISIKGSLHNIFGSHNVTPEQLEAYINNKRKQFGIIIPFAIDVYIKNKNMNKFSDWLGLINNDSIDLDWSEPLFYRSKEEI